MKRRELVERSRSVAVSVAAAIEFAGLELMSETDRERPWRNGNEDEVGEAVVGDEGEEVVLWLLCSLDRIWV